MFVHSDITDSRSLEDEIIRRLATRVVDVFRSDVKSDANHARACDCRDQPVKEDQSDSGLVTLAAIEVILEDAMYPVLERLLAIERKLLGSDPNDRQEQDVPVTVTPSSTPAFVYDDQPRLSPISKPNYTFAGSLFDTSDFVNSEEDGNDYGSSAGSISDLGRDDEAKEKGECEKDFFYRSFFKAPDKPDDRKSSDIDKLHSNHRPDNNPGKAGNTNESLKVKARNKHKRKA